MTNNYTAKGNFSDAALSEEDRQRIRALSEVYEKAAASGDKTAAELAHKTAEEIRSRYGYSGGEDGSEYIKLDTGASSLADYLTGLYGAKTQNALAALESAYSRSAAEARERLRGVGPEFDEYRNRASAENEIEKRGFAERAASAGMNRGASSQAELSRSVAYQNALAEISGAEKAELSALKSELSRLGEDYRSAMADAVSKGEYELAGALYDEAVRAQSADQKARESAEKAAENETKRQLELAQTAAKYGDYSLLRALGVDAQEQTKTGAKASGTQKSGTQKSGAAAQQPGSAALAEPAKDGESTPEELFELMYENEPNEYLYLTLQRENWNIPVSSLGNIWEEYGAWRKKRIAEDMKSNPPRSRWSGAGKQYPEP